MKTTIGRNVFRKPVPLVWAIMVAACFLLVAASGLAQMLPPGAGGGLTNAPLDSWSFNDTNNWTDDASNTPVSFTNITGMVFGDYTSMMLDSTNPAWLNYNIYEPTGTTNLTVDQGSFFVWFAPAWAGTNEGGNGPGQYGRLLEVGGYTPDASFGWWSLYCDPAGANLYFSVQPGDGSTTTYLTAPIQWTSNAWHFVALTYDATNTALYLDGMLATNGPGLSGWPGTNVLAGGFYLGSDSNGLNQASGSFDDLYTYNVVLDTNAIKSGYNLFWADYYLTPWNYSAELTSAPSSPSYTPTYEAITGGGNLSWVANASSCVDGSSAYDVWITNVSATISGTGSNNMSLTFTIEGGEPNVPYDVFANSVLHFGTNGIPWAWMGQGYQCNTYTLTNLPSTDCFIILGTPQDSSGSGLTDAYELLVLQTSPYGPQSDSYGVPYAWYAQHGLTTLTNGLATADPDQDGILNYQEYLYGTNPQVSEGFAIWVSTPNGTSSIP